MGYSFEIVTDSCCNLPEDIIDECGLHILPMTFMAEGEPTVYQSYLKGERTDLSQFYRMMREGKVFKTSLPNLGDTKALLCSLLDAGRDVLYLGFSSGLSGTYEAVNNIIAEVRGDYPDRTILAVDTLAASGGQGLLVWHAAQRAQAGEGIKEVRDWVEANKLNLAHWFTVDDLMFLFRGGRVSRTSAWAGSLLNIKPVLHVDDEGHLIAMEKVRGRKKSLNALLDHMAASAREAIDTQMVFLFHGDCADEADYLARRLKDDFGVQRLVVNYIDPVIGAHSGPGTMALFFLANQR